MRKRLRLEGADNFEDHQLLEALLFFSVARCDTNDRAHGLIEQCGSLASVFSVSRDELTRVEGIGDNSADLIALVSELTRRIALADVSPRDSYNSVSKIAKYLANLYVGVSVERVYMMLFDNGLHLLDCVHVCDGTINSAVMQPRVMAKKALYSDASVAVIAHNHPRGNAIPSDDDFIATEKLSATFDLVGVQLLEHIVIAGQSYTPIIKQMHMRGRELAGESIVRTGNGIKLLNGVAFEYFYDGKWAKCETVTDLPAVRADGLDKI
ncbi:MAG: hypothetical protein IJY27_03365 [Clostridia bacterium]|nr:hypothetical protein [Clostridia bacterium]